MSMVVIDEGADRCGLDDELRGASLLSKVRAWLEFPHLVVDS